MRVWPFAMKICIAIAMMAVAGISLSAQELRNAFFVAPYRTGGDLGSSCFWTRYTIALLAVDAAAKATDSFATRKNIDGGGDEYNPLARPFVHTPGVQFASMAAFFGAEIGVAYWLHRRGHGNSGRAVLGAGAVANGLGAASSFKHRVGW